MNTLTRPLAVAAGRDAANRQMRTAGRTVWSLADQALASQTTNGLLWQGGFLTTEQASACGVVFYQDDADGSHYPTATMGCFG